MAMYRILLESIMGEFHAAVGHSHCHDDSPDPSPKRPNMKRRAFLRTSAIGMATLAGTGLSGLTAERQGNDENADAAISPSVHSGEQAIGRPARLVSIGFKGGSQRLEQIVDQVDREAARGADLIVLPETCRGHNKSTQEALHGPTVTALATLAAKYKTYIAVPIDRRDGDRRLNSVVLLDRSGQVACVYDKVFPYWAEYNLDPPVSPGESGLVYTADFGRVGIATCFDVNYPEVWRHLADMGAEVVIWPSAYSGGRSLQAHALNHHYYIVSSTGEPDCAVYDIDGSQILYGHSQGVNVSRITLDLDRTIYHQNFNLKKRDRLLTEHADDIAQEKWMALEQWFVLKAKRPGVSTRELCRQYEMEELRHYLDRSRSAIDGRRGWDFAAKVVFPAKTADQLKALSSHAQRG